MHEVGNIPHYVESVTAQLKLQPVRHIAVFMGNKKLRLHTQGRVLFSYCGGSILFTEKRKEPEPCFPSAGNSAPAHGFQPLDFLYPLQKSHHVLACSRILRGGRAGAVPFLNFAAPYNGAYPVCIKISVHMARVCYFSASFGDRGNILYRSVPVIAEPSWIRRIICGRAYLNIRQQFPSLPLYSSRLSVILAAFSFADMCLLNALTAISCSSGLSTVIISTRSPSIRFT